MKTIAQDIDVVIADLETFGYNGNEGLSGACEYFETIGALRAIRNRSERREQVLSENLREAGAELTELRVTLGGMCDDEAVDKAYGIAANLTGLASGLLLMMDASAYGDKS